MEKNRARKVVTNRQRKLNRWGYLFILPNFIGFLVFMLIPIIMALLYSLTNYDVISTPQFIGVRNYIKIFTDRQFLTALVNTLYYTVLTVPVGIVLSLLLAVLFNRAMKGIAIFRALVFIPVITSTVSVSLVWSMLYDENSGLFNIIIKFFGGRGVR